MTELQAEHLETSEINTAPGCGGGGENKEEELFFWEQPVLHEPPVTYRYQFRGAVCCKEDKKRGMFVFGP